MYEVDPPLPSHLVQLHLLLGPVYQHKYMKRAYMGIFLSNAFHKCVIVRLKKYVFQTSLFTINLHFSMKRYFYVSSANRSLNEKLNMIMTNTLYWAIMYISYLKGRKLHTWTETVF